MKKILLAILFIIGYEYSVSCQIKLREGNMEDKPILRPQCFDSLTDITYQKRPIDYKKYIGYQIYFKPFSKKCDAIKNYGVYTAAMNYSPVDYLFSNDTSVIIKNGKIPYKEIQVTFDSRLGYKNKKEYDEKIDKEKTNVYMPHFYHYKTDRMTGAIWGNIYSDPDSLGGTYFTITDIKAYNNGLKKLEDIDPTNDRAFTYLYIFLKDEKRNKSLYWKCDVSTLKNYFGDMHPFILVPYFEKLQKTYLNQDVYFPSEKKDLVDVNTRELVTIKKGEVWTCSDVSLSETKKQFVKLTYFLKKGDIEVAMTDRGFILESKHQHELLEQQIKEEEKKRAEEEKMAEDRRKQEEFRADCIRKWGQKKGEMIANGMVSIGMTKEQCETAWGFPINKTISVLTGHAAETWYYGYGSYLYFENDILKIISK